MRVLVDTNVVIDVLQRRKPHFADSHAVVMACAQGNVEGWFVPRRSPTCSISCTATFTTTSPASMW
jgi:hypothetical protein